jgi:hypothetical protein
MWAGAISFALLLLGFLGFLFANGRDLGPLSNLSAIVGATGLGVIAGFRVDKPWYLWPCGTFLRISWLLVMILKFVFYICVGFLVCEIGLMTALLTLGWVAFPRDIIHSSGKIMAKAGERVTPFW